MFSIRSIERDVDGSTLTIETQEMTAYGTEQIRGVMTLVAGHDSELAQQIDKLFPGQKVEVSIQPLDEDGVNYGSAIKV